LENQEPLSDIVSGSDQFLNAAITEFGGTLAGAEADNNQKYDVGVLALTGANGAPAQPMLTLLPDGGSALLLLGMSLSGLALISRKMRA
jgi:VPDSG-CTERM motif